jgi:hypothetical protein
MSLLRPIPTGVSNALNEDGMKFLPSFVHARLQYLADIFDWSDDELFTYHEVQGKLSEGHYSVAPGKHITPINIWIASDDNCQRSLYIGGSSCWICPDSHYLFFDAIDPTLLPENPDPNVWWCIKYEEGIKVIKILVHPPEEMTEDFPHGV